MHRTAVAIAIALCSSACGQQTHVTTEQPPPAAGTIVRSEWALAWSDEFDGASGSGVDAAKWGHDIGDGCQAGICGWGNQEKEYYTTAAENISLDGSGHLLIVGRVAPSGLNCYYGACRYTSAKITTRARINAGPGLVEARVQLPAGQGLWPAFWMLGSNFPLTPWPNCGELDIMENKGSQPALTSSAIHGPGYSGATPFARSRPIAGGTFHVYSVAWDSQRIRFFVDDTLHYLVQRTEIESKGNWVFDQPFFVILNLAIGGQFDGDPASDAILPATMLVDYVRGYTPK